MPARSPSPKRLPKEKPPIAPDTPPPGGAASGTDLPLPHERDESAQRGAQAPDRLIRRAHDDLAEGQVDTDMRATPGLDARRRRRLVRGPGGR